LLQKPHTTFNFYIPVSDGHGKKKYIPSPGSNFVGKETT
jgi:hypothetical protein